MYYDSALSTDSTGSTDYTASTDSSSSSICEPNRFDGYSHVTWYVGNAKIFASYFVSRMGFQHVAYFGLENGSRNIAAHVVGNGKIRMVFVSGLRSVGKVEASKKKADSKNGLDIGFSGYCSDEKLLREIYEHLAVST